MVADLLSPNRCHWYIAKIKNYNLNVTELRGSDFKNAFPGIFNFTVGILAASFSGRAGKTETYWPFLNPNLVSGFHHCSNSLSVTILNRDTCGVADSRHFLYKVGCVVPMVIWSEFHMGLYRDDDHREQAPHFIYQVVHWHYLGSSDGVNFRLLRVCVLGHHWTDRGSQYDWSKLD